MYPQTSIIFQILVNLNILFAHTEVWLSDSGDEYYAFEVMSILPYVNISKCRGDTGNPDCDTHDSCMYEVVEEHDNVHVEVLRCKRCGNIELSWYKNKPDDLDVDISIGDESL